MEEKRQIIDAIGIAIKDAVKDLNWVIRIGRDYDAFLVSIEAPGGWTHRAYLSDNTSMRVDVGPGIFEDFPLADPNFPHNMVRRLMGVFFVDMCVSAMKSMATSMYKSTPTQAYNIFNQMMQITKTPYAKQILKKIDILNKLHNLIN